MTPNPVAFTPETPIAEAARLARDGDAELFPVVEAGELVGTVTTCDLLGVLAGLLRRRGASAIGHIVAAVSLRSGPARAMAEALELADATGAAVTALHVLPDPPLTSTAEGATAEIVVWAEGARRRLAERALEAMRRLGQRRDVRCEVTEGAVAAEIARCGEELGADLIVVGGTPRRWWTPPLPRTTAEEVARRSSCPVLTVAEARR